MSAPRRGATGPAKYIGGEIVAPFQGAMSWGFTYPGFAPCGRSHGAILCLAPLGRSRRSAAFETYPWGKHFENVMFTKGGGSATAFCRALLGGCMWAGLPNARPSGACIGLRLSRTVVRWPLSRPTLNCPLGKESVKGNICHSCQEGLLENLNLGNLSPRRHRGLRGPKPRGPYPREPKP